MPTPTHARLKLDVPAHPRFKGFEAFAAREIFPWLAAKESERLAARRRGWRVAAVTAVVAVALVVLAFDEEEEVWRGLLIALPAARRFRGFTTVAPERGGLASLGAKPVGERVRLALSAPEEGIEARSTDPDEALEVLTERAMRRLAELAAQLGHQWPSLALVEDSVLLAITTGKDRFGGGSLSEPLAQAQRINKLLADFALLFEIADALKAAFPERARRA